MVGGAHRGPVGVGRQRRTIRLVQGLLVLLAAGVLLFAGYSMGRSSGYEAGRDADAIDAPRAPAASQTVVLVLLGLGVLGGAFALQTEGGVRLLTPAKLHEMEQGFDLGPQPAIDEEEEDQSAGSA